MQMLTETVDLDMDWEYRGVSFMPEEEETELIHRAASGDVEAKLQLVKDHLDLVVVLAAEHASETGKPFSQAVQAGASAVIKAADDFHRSQQIGFIDYLRLEAVRAMEGIG